MELSSVLDAGEWTEFLECYRRKSVRCRASDDRDRFRPLWEDWELEAVCRFTPLTNVDRFRLVRDAKRVPPAGFRDRFGMVRAEAVRQLFAGGVSVSLANLEFYSDPVLALSRSLERHLGCPVQVSFYATPKASQALAAHRDEHDVLVIQMRGSKHWEIYHSADDPAQEAEVPRHYTLHSGSWLYVPRNMRHEVKNVGPEPSVHLTVGFHPLTWGTIFSDALERAKVASRALNDVIPSAPLPAESPEQMVDRLRTILSFVNLPAQVEEFHRHYPRLGGAVPAPVSRAELEGIVEDSPLIWRTDGASLEARSGSLAINTAYRGGPLDLRPELEPVLVAMARGEIFRPAGIALAEPGSRTMLCRFLTLVGALRRIG